MIRDRSDRPLLDRRSDKLMAIKAIAPESQKYLSRLQVTTVR
jgi:hypothetical protein